MNRTTLFYLENGVPIDTIWTTYSGFTNSWFDSFLYFLPDKRILTDITWNRQRKEPNKFLIDVVDYSTCFVEDTIFHTLSQTTAYTKKLDSLFKDGRYYRIVLSSPEYEKDLFNENNPHTRVKFSKSLTEIPY